MFRMDEEKGKERYRQKQREQAARRKAVLNSISEKRDREGVERLTSKEVEKLTKAENRKRRNKNETQNKANSKCDHYNLGGKCERTKCCSLFFYTKNYLRDSQLNHNIVSQLNHKVFHSLIIKLYDYSIKV